MESRAFCVTTSMNPHELTLPARCFTGVRRSTWLRDTECPLAYATTIAEPQSIPSKALAPIWVATRTLARFLLERHGPKSPSEGLASSTPHLARCSMRVPLLENPSNIPLSPATGVQLLQWSGHASSSAKAAVPTTPREGWRHSEGQDVWTAPRS